MNERRCVHTWIVEPPNGPVSFGRCDSCGETKEFPNAIGELDFMSDERRRRFKVAGATSGALPDASQAPLYSKIT